MNNTISRKVFDALVEFPETRTNDELLIERVYEKFGIDTNQPFSIVLLDKSSPSIETILRTKRLIKSKIATIQTKKEH